MAQRKKEVIKIMDERLAELGFSFDQSVSAAGIWGFTRIVDTSWCFDYPSESNCAVEGIFIEKDRFTDQLYLTLSDHSVENIGERHFNRQGKLLMEHYGAQEVCYKTDKEKAPNPFCTKPPEESFEDAVRILRDIAVDYGLDIIKDWEKNAHGGPLPGADTEDFLKNYKKIAVDFEKQYLAGIDVKEQMNEIRRLLFVGRNKRYVEVAEILNGAAAYIGDKIIEQYNAEWGEFQDVQIALRPYQYERIKIMWDLRRMWIKEDYPQRDIDEYGRFLAGEAIFDWQKSCVVR